MLFNTSSIPMFNYCTQGGCGCQPVKGYTVRTLATVTYSVAKERLGVYPYTRIGVCRVFRIVLLVGVGCFCYRGGISGVFFWLGRL